MLAGDLDELLLRTVGIDVGSATSHLMLSEVHLARRAVDLSSRYEVVARRTLWESPVAFTPYLSDETIDAGALRGLVRGWFEAAGVAPAQLDTGAVLLTGTALYRHNARAIAESLAEDAGRFVCAAAGHHLEAVLAAGGSGASAASARLGVPVVNVDVGGGTAKFATAQGGRVTATAAVLAGARLVAWDAARRLTRVEPAAELVAGRAGVALEVGAPLEEDDAERLAGALARVVVSQLTGGADDGDARLRVTEPFTPPAGGYRLMLSGGVAECLSEPAPVDRGDLGGALARAIVAEIGRAGLAGRLLPAEHRLRATVTGVSQFATQVSGATLHLPDPAALPLHDVPVIAPSFELSGEPETAHVAGTLSRALDARRAELSLAGRVAVSVKWSGPPAYRRLRALGAGLKAGLAGDGWMRPDRPVILVVDADLAASIGRMMVRELGWGDAPLVCLDGLDVGELDFLDVGRPAVGGGACPVVVKSLLFSA